MIVTPLAPHSVRAVRDALRSHGWDEGRAETAAGGVHPVAFHITSLDAVALEALVPMAGRLGLELLTGDDWAVLAGSRARLSALARPWLVPPELSALAMQVGLAMPAERVAHWRTARGALALDRPVVMGILNVTPDSFSDGGRYRGLDAALVHADRMLEAGAGMLDVGGQSSRPGADQVTPTEELDRVVPVIEALVRRHAGVLLSVDTVRAEVARAALDVGAAAVNDVTAFRLEPAMAEVVAARGAGAVLMHSRGAFGELASFAHARYDDPVAEVMAELKAAIDAATAAGVAEETIVVDPGLGFSKTAEQSALLADQLAALAALGRPVLVGPSRKRFIGHFAGIEAPADRDHASAVACALAYERGARLFRVHDVAAAREALALTAAILHSPEPLPTA